MSGTNHQDTTRQADGHGPELPPAGPDIGAGTGSVHRIEEGQLRHTPTCACGICLRNYGPVDQRQYPPTEEAAKSRQEKRAVLNIDDPSFIMSETRVYQTIEALRAENDWLRELASKGAAEIERLRAEVSDYQSRLTAAMEDAVGSADQQRRENERLRQEKKA